MNRLPTLYRRWLLLALVVIFATPWAHAAVVHQDPLREREVAIARQLRCTVCQAESVAESNAGIARDMRKLIRQKLAQGQSSTQIIHYFVARYGDYILLKPRFDRLGAILWVAPVGLLLLLGAVAYGFLRRRSALSGPQYPELSVEDEDRVRAAQSRD